MILGSGTHLGPYEIVGKIGAGGMGEVWKAKDTRLGRDVAIKVLPAAFAEAPERLKRFEQEARMVAALSHPNVLAIFDVGTYEGSPYLVSELLKGATLRERLSGGPLPVSKTLDIAIQVARGLAAAHDKGIIHRDLKPENIFLTHEGVKILDFGLAKQAQAVQHGSQSELPTRDFHNATQEGAILGTVGYMSPEQVRGEAVDARSDLFALGVVIYEMLSGRQAFHGRTQADTLSAILREEPPDLDAGLKVPPLLERVLRSCLSKEVEGRFHSAHDLAFALESLGTTGSSGDHVVEQVMLSSPQRRWVLPMVAVSAVVLLALGAVFLWKPWRSSPPPWDPRCVAILPFENRTGDLALDNLGQQVVDLVRQDLQQVDNLKVAADVAYSHSGDPARHLAEATKARFVAAGAYYLRGGEIELQARLVDPWTGKVIHTLGPWRGPKEDPAKGLAELRQVLGGAVGWAYENFWQLEPGATHPPRLEALLAFRKGYKTWGRDYAASGSAFERAQALDPAFFMARLMVYGYLMTTSKFEEADAQLVRIEADYERLTPVERALVRANRARLEGRPLEAIKAYEDMARIHPDTIQIRADKATMELMVNRTGSAIRDLRLIPAHSFEVWGIQSDFWAATDLCKALHMAGNYSGQLRAAREAEVTFPDVLEFRANEAAALAALGRLQELELVLQATGTVAPSPGGLSARDVMFEAVVELRAHAQIEASQRLAARLLTDYFSLPLGGQKTERKSIASLLVHLDRGAEALDILQDLAAEDPKDVGLRGGMGALKARLGRLDEARKVEEELTALARPYLNGRQTYWRACIATQLGEKDRAVSLLSQAFGQGFPFSLKLHREIYLEPLRGYPPFDELMKPKD